MIRWITFGSILCFVLAAPPADLFAQASPYGYGSNPNASGVDPRVRRAYRERAVAIIGPTPTARDFVETQGDEAVVAIFACSRPVAVKLVEFYASGELGKLPRPCDLLRVIAQPRHGDDVARWAIAHAGELADTDSFDAYLLSPLDYALGLRQLETGAAEARARRLNMAAMATRSGAPPLSQDEKLALFGGAGLLLIVLVVWWRRRQASMW